MTLAGRAAELGGGMRPVASPLPDGTALPVGTASPAIPLAGETPAPASAEPRRTSTEPWRSSPRPPIATTELTPGRRLAARGVGLAAAAVLGLHVWAAINAGLGSLMGLSMLALASVCVPCVVSVLSRPSDAVLRMLVVTSALVASAHLLLCIADGHGAHPHGAGSAEAGAGSAAGAGPAAVAGPAAGTGLTGGAVADAVAADTGGLVVMFTLAALDYAVGLAAVALLRRRSAGRQLLGVEMASSS